MTTGSAASLPAARQTGTAKEAERPFDGARRTARERQVDALERALSSGQRSGRNGFYPVPPPNEVWPRVFPQL